MSPTDTVYLQSILKKQQGEGSPYAGMILENYRFIEKQCHKAMAHLPLSPDTNLRENEVDELINDVIDRLSVNDFKVLRDFQGKSKITTYIATIIANIIVDAVRSKKGRNRIYDRAKENGALGLKLYDLIFIHNYSLQEAYEYLKASHGIASSLADISDLLDKIRGRIFPVTDSVPDHQRKNGESGQHGLQELDLPDDSKNPAELVICQQRTQTVQRMLTEILSELKGEDKLTLRMKYPTNDLEHSKSNREIAEMLGLKEKAVESRIRRILACSGKLFRRNFSNCVKSKRKLKPSKSGTANRQMLPAVQYPLFRWINKNKILTGGRDCPWHFPLRSRTDHQAKTGFLDSPGIIVVPLTFLLPLHLQNRAARLVGDSLAE